MLCKLPNNNLISNGLILLTPTVYILHTLISELMTYILPVRNYIGLVTKEFGALF